MQGVCAFELDAMHDLSHHRVNGISEGSDGFDRQTAGARFRPGKVMLVDQQYGLSGGGEIIGGRAPGRPRSHHHRVPQLAHSIHSASSFAESIFREVIFQHLT